MSNNIPPSTDVKQAGGANGNSLIDTQKIEEDKEFKEAVKTADLIISAWESQFPTPESLADILLGWEAAGFPPKKMEKNPLKAKLEHINFKTTEWQEWWSKVEPMTREDIEAELKERNERREQNEN